MMNVCEEFVSDLTKVESVRLAREEAIKEWGQDIPTTLLFAKLGKCVAERFDEFSPEERTLVFRVIEGGMKASSSDLNTFVATGFLEALYTRASRTGDLFQRIDAQLGEASRQYLSDWNAWHRQKELGSE